MIHLFSLYLAVVGGVTAGTQVARGAAAEVIGGLVAPVVSAVPQCQQLGVDVCVSVAVLTSGRPEDTDEPAAHSPSGERRQRASAVAANGAA